MGEDNRLGVAGAPGDRRTWLLDGSTGSVICPRGARNNCFVIGATNGGTGGEAVFLKANKATNFHPDELIELTDEINGLLGGFLERNREGRAPEEKLAILHADRGMVLAWVRCPPIEAEDTKELEEQLGL